MFVQNKKRVENISPFANKATVVVVSLHSLSSSISQERILVGNRFPQQRYKSVVTLQTHFFSASWQKYLMGLGTGMSRNLFNVVPRAFVALFLRTIKGNKDCNLFGMYVFLRMLTKVLVRLFVPHVLQHHDRH